VIRLLNQGSEGCEEPQDGCGEGGWKNGQKDGEVLMEKCWARQTRTLRICASCVYLQSSHPHLWSCHSTPATSGLALHWGRWYKPHSECLHSSNAEHSLEDERTAGLLHKKRGSFQKRVFSHYAQEPLGSKKIFLSLTQGWYFMRAVRKSQWIQTVGVGTLHHSHSYSWIDGEFIRQ
jgi:hypothetical protein